MLATCVNERLQKNVPNEIIFLIKCVLRVCRRYAVDGQQTQTNVCCGENVLHRFKLLKGNHDSEPATFRSVALTADPTNQEIT